MVKISDDGIILTLDSDEEVEKADMSEDDEEEDMKEKQPKEGQEEEEEEQGEEAGKGGKQKEKGKKRRREDKKKQAVEMDPEFMFGDEDDGFGDTSWDFRDALAKLGVSRASATKPSTADEMDVSEEEEDDGLDEDALRDLTTDKAINKQEAKRKRKQEKEAAAAQTAELQMPQDTDHDPRAKDFFEEVGDDLRIRAGASGGPLVFNQLNLSRPLLRAVEGMGYVTPTPIQTAVIPVVLAGKDVCGSAVTGSGKTAAFLLPILERLLYRPKRIPAIRVLIISPTRELAFQTHVMLEKLSRFTDVASCLVVGGSKNLRAQEAELRARPDIVVCTPGRMLDHLTNSHSVTLEDLEILVMDEVDQLLDLGFQAEMESLVKECPQSRQTLFFSATMTAKVDALAQVSLRKPVRVRADPSFEVAPRLVQEFVRVRSGNKATSEEEHRHAILLALVSRTFKNKTLLFVSTKIEAHRIKLLLESAGIKAGELHGNLNQANRLESLQRFKEGGATVLVCTDVAARGLDIAGIETVINAEMPRSRSTYVHRVGRTARAGCGGRAVTLVTEAMRIMMKQIVADVDDKSSVKSRVIPPAVLSHYEAKVAALASVVEEKLEDEDAERIARRAEMEADKAENILTHEDEIKNRPVRQWFQSEAEKKAVRAQAVAKAKGEGGGEGGGKRTAAVREVVEKKPKANQKPHRLSRKKRRRMEALAGEEAEAAAGQGGDGDDGGDGGEEERPAKKKAKGGMDVSQKSAARMAKKLAQPGRLTSEAKPAGKQRRSGAGVLDIGSSFDYDMQYGKPAAAEAGGGGGKKKGGGGKGGDGDEGERTSSFKFRGPNTKELRKAGKPSHHAFKSKSKHKRRK